MVQYLRRLRVSGYGFMNEGCGIENEGLRRRGVADKGTRV